MLTPWSNEQSINISNSADGIYFVKVESGGKYIAGKIVIQK
ncbi:MAG: T9SS type A sorting domain-containing protein [Bacteroidetes bacterium]|nr:T9SS type A sorting domain-containing protein [Bacteroidota bacterium]